jgi:hypothetical protein
MSVYANFVECVNPGTYTVTALTSKIKVYLVAGGGGGGGGGGGQHNNSRRDDRSGGGGGSGSSGEIQFWTNTDNTIKGKPIIVTIGSGGAGGQPGTDGDPYGNNGINGGNGNTTTVAVGSESISAAGGNGGSGGSKGWKGGVYGLNNVGIPPGENNAPGGKGGNPSGTHSTLGNPGGYGSNASQKGRITTGSNGGAESSPLNNNSIYTLGNTVMSVSNAGIYPNDIKPGVGGKGGQGSYYLPQNAGLPGNNGYARIYFIDN